jgi:hypothetical protein
MAVNHPSVQEFAAKRAGVMVVLATAVLLAFLHKDTSIGDMIMARPSLAFFELMIALTGGAAGACATLSPRLSAAYRGVAIATALAFPLACCAALLAGGEFELASGAFLLAIVSILVVESAASLVMWTSHGAGRYSGRPPAPSFISLGVLLLLAGLLVANLRGLVGGMLFEASVRHDMKQGYNHPGAPRADMRVAQQERSARAPDTERPFKPDT